MITKYNVAREFYNRDSSALIGLAFRGLFKGHSESPVERATREYVKRVVPKDFKGDEVVLEGER